MAYYTHSAVFILGINQYMILTNKKNYDKIIFGINKN